MSAARIPIDRARPMARKPFVVNAAVREKVRHLAGLGVRQDDIARIVKCSPKTLRKRCRDDLDGGAAEANAIVSGSLFAAAKGGNVVAQIFWLKTRAQWRERAVLDDRAADGDAGANAPVVLVLPDNGRDPELVPAPQDVRESLERQRRG
jgi:hypothetical protein